MTQIDIGKYALYFLLGVYAKGKMLISCPVRS